MIKIKSLSLLYKLLLLSYITVLCICWFCVFQTLKGSFTNKINSLFESACNEQFRLGNSIKTMAENKHYSPENQRYYLLGAVKNGMESYAQYYSGDETFFQISNLKGELVHGNFPAQRQNELTLYPQQDGSINYCLKSIEDKKVVFVSSYVKIYTTLFRFDYAQDVTQSLEEEIALTKRISWIMFLSLVLLTGLLYYGVRNALKPLNQLGDQAKAIAGGIYDMRVQVVHDDEVGSVAIEFNNMAEAVENHINMITETARLRELFAANLAHEIKTPITSIMGYADYAARKELNKEELYYIQNYIKQEAKRLDSLSQKLLEWSDISHLQKANFKACDTRRLFRHVLMTVNPVIEKNKQQVLEENQVSAIFADEILFVSLLSNLLVNASRASGENDIIEFSMALQTIPEKKLIVQVKDHGIGIGEEDISRVVEPFYMADKARDRRNSGSGLGLALCSAIVKAHHGVMTIESKVDIGTTVTVIIPQPDNFDNLFTFA